MDTPAMTTPTEGLESTPDSAQETETIAQPQTVTAPMVDGTQSTSKAPAEGTPDYETARQLKNLMKEFRSLKQSLNTRSSETPHAAPQAPQVTRDDLVKDPILAIRKILDGSRSEIKDDIIKEIQRKDAEIKHERAVQEGLRLIETNELIKKDPNGEDRWKEILYEEDSEGNSLQKYSYVNPKHAAQLVLKEYQLRYGQGKTASAPSKAQMATTATAQTAGGGRMTSESEIGAIYAELARNPELMNDKKFMDKLDAVMKKSNLESMVGK